MIPGWLDDIEEEVVSCLCRHGTMSARELGMALGISEACAVHHLYLLASEGRLAIEVTATAPITRVPDLTASLSGREQGCAEGEDHGVLVGGSVG